MLNMCLFFLILLFSCLLFSQGINSFAQEQNPFELTYRKGQKETVKSISENPFEKLNPIEEKVVEKEKTENLEENKRMRAKCDKPMEVMTSPAIKFRFFM